MFIKNVIKRNQKKSEKQVWNLYTLRFPIKVESYLISGHFTFKS